MKRIDVANGDADGLCALHQLRLAEGGGDTLVTGVKRDVALLERVEAGADALVTVCDISLDANRAGLERLLAAGAQVRYFDHHFAGEIPTHPALQAQIDTAPGVCTSLIVDRHLGGRHRAWAVAACFGDNLAGTAQQLAATLALAAPAIAALRELGECINYNAYGETVEDLHVPPAVLYARLAHYEDPLRCHASEPMFAELRRGRDQDLARAARVAPRLERDWCTAVALPDEAWSRRVNGEFANRLATAAPQRGIAVLAPGTSGDWVVSLRAPREHARGAAALARAFPTGGGRAQAAGINRLPDAMLASFLERFETYFRSD